MMLLIAFSSLRFSTLLHTCCRLDQHYHKLGEEWAARFGAVLLVLQPELIGWNVQVTSTCACRCCQFWCWPAPAGCAQAIRTMFLLCLCARRQSAIRKGGLDAARSDAGLLTDSWDRLRGSAAEALLRLPAPLPGCQTGGPSAACWNLTPWGRRTRLRAARHWYILTAFAASRNMFLAHSVSHSSLMVFSFIIPHGRCRPNGNTGDVWTT